MLVLIDLDRHLRCVADDVAVMAPGQVLFQFGARPGVNDAVQVVCQLFQKLRAGHLVPSPLSPLPRCRKYLVSRLRNCSRARSNRDFTAGMLKSSASAVSSVDRPSTSRSTKTVRKLGGSP